MLVKDATLFVKMFSKPITKSAPHTHISVLSFIPSSSWIYKNYRAVNGRTIDVLRGALEEWPGYIWQSRGHDNWVTSVAFSPDGKQIVSGSWDRKICLWDAASGQLIGSPLEGHRDSVTSVAFSPVGKQTVSAGASDSETPCKCIKQGVSE
jgi:WD40 repeat protein